MILPLTHVDVTSAGIGLLDDIDIPDHAQWELDVEFIHTGMAFDEDGLSSIGSTETIYVCPSADADALASVPEHFGVEADVDDPYRIQGIPLPTSQVLVCAPDRSARVTMRRVLRRVG